MASGTRVTESRRRVPAGGRRMSTSGTTVSIRWPRVAAIGGRRCYGKLRPVTREGRIEGAVRVRPPRLQTINPRAPTYIGFLSRGIRWCGASMSTRAPSRRGKTHAIGGVHNDHRRASADDVQLLIMLDLAALVPSMLRQEPRSIGGAESSPQKTARFVILMLQIRAPRITRARQVPDR